MTKPSMSDEAVQNATGKTWGEWFTLLNEIQANELPHKEIAQMVQEQYDVSGWWAQTVTVDYERHIGRRDVGQSHTGDFQASASRTLPGSIDEVLAMWQKYVADATDFDGVAFLDTPNVSQSGNWRYWRVELGEQGKVNISIWQKSPEKSQLGVHHEKLSDAEAAERWKTFWRAYLKGL